MGNVNHLHLVASGGYVPGVPLLAREEWAVNLNLLPSIGDPDDIADMTTGDFDAAPAILQRTETGWSASSNFLAEGGQNDVDPVDYLAEQALTAFTALIGGGNGSFSYISNVVEMRALTLYAIGADGKVIELPSGPAKAELSLTTTVKGASGGAGIAPLQTTVGISWVTAANTPRGRGRIFLPPPSQTIMGAQGVMADATALGYAGAGADLIAALTVGGDATVVPIVTGKPYHTGYRIKRCRVGNILDTQRRRVAQLNETYQVADVS